MTSTIIRQSAVHPERVFFPATVLLLTLEQQPLYAAFVAGMMADFAAVGIYEGAGKAA